MDLAKAVPFTKFEHFFSGTDVIEVGDQVSIEALESRTSDGCRYRHAEGTVVSIMDDGRYILEISVDGRTNWVYVPAANVFPLRSTVEEVEFVKTYHELGLILIGLSDTTKRRGFVTIDMSDLSLLRTKCWIQASQEHRNTILVSDRFAIRTTAFWQGFTHIEILDVTNGQTAEIPCSIDYYTVVERDFTKSCSNHYFAYKDRIIAYNGKYLICWKFGNTFASFQEVFKMEITGCPSVMNPIVFFRGAAYMGIDGEILKFDPVNLTTETRQLPKPTHDVFTRRAGAVDLKIEDDEDDRIMVERYIGEDVSVAFDGARDLGKWLANQILNNPKEKHIVAGRVLKRINQVLAQIYRDFPNIVAISKPVDEAAIIQKFDDFKACGKFRVEHDMSKKDDARFIVYCNDDSIGGVSWFYRAQWLREVRPDGNFYSSIPPEKISVEEARYAFGGPRVAFNRKVIEYTLDKYCWDFIRSLLRFVQDTVFPVKLSQTDHFDFDGEKFVAIQEPNNVHKYGDIQYLPGSSSVYTSSRVISYDEAITINAPKQGCAQKKRISESNVIEDVVDDLSKMYQYKNQRLYELTIDSKRIPICCHPEMGCITTRVRWSRNILVVSDKYYVNFYKF